MWVAEMTTHIQESINQDHAALAMRAAKKVSRVRRRSQKEKIGHTVCQHLLCLLNAEEDVATSREARINASLTKAKQLDPEDERQMSMAF